MAALKVLIVGGGIAGNALAFWLSKQHHDVTVVERYPEMRTNGLQIDLRGHGVEVMKRMGIEPAFRSKQVPEQGLQVVDSRNRRWAYFPANTSGRGLQSFTTDAEIMRGDLCRLLYEAVQSRARYRFGISIESLDEGDNSIEVKFTGGETERYDLVVGADGMGSRTRRLAFGPDTPKTFQPLGDVYAAYFTIPQSIEEGEEYLATFYTAPGRRAIMTRRHNPHKMQVYLSCKSNAGQVKGTRRGNVDEEKEAFEKYYQGAGWKTDEIMQAMKHTDDFYCERMGLVKLPCWSQGRVTLVGDAAWCPTAMTGMGTTSGMVGAYILAGEISRHCGSSKDGNDMGQADKKEDLAAALKAYEAKFRPFMEQVQRGVSEDIYSKLPSSQWGIFFMNFLLWVVALLRLNLLGNWLLREEVRGWDLPEYEGLLRD